MQCSCRQNQMCIQLLSVSYHVPLSPLCYQMAFNLNSWHKLNEKTKYGVDPCPPDQKLRRVKLPELTQEAHPDAQRSDDSFPRLLEGFVARTQTYVVSRHFLKWRMLSFFLGRLLRPIGSLLEKSWGGIDLLRGNDVGVVLHSRCEEWKDGKMKVTSSLPSIAGSIPCEYCEYS